MYWDFSFSHPTIWVFLALCIIIAAAIWKGVLKVIAKSLDARGEAIAKELDDAKNLREQAQALLNSYKRKQAEAEEQAIKIVTQAKKDAENMATQARVDFKERLARRAVMAESKIKAAETQAMADVKARAVDLATKAAENLIREQYKTGDHSNIIKDSISQMGKAFH
ncbi:MAG: F0F1 ATP synthase subunit B [Robiginitomaculum sp.]